MDSPSERPGAPDPEPIHAEPIHAEPLHPGPIHSEPGHAERVQIGGVYWYVDYEAAVDLARRQDKALWVHFGENPG